jgi:hypothetical protein
MGMIKEKEPSRQNGAHKLLSLTERFPRGLALGREDLAIIGWLYLYEQETGSQSIFDSQLKWLIPEALGHLDCDAQAQIPSQIVQRLMRFGILRVAIADSTHRGYRLTCLGQALARGLIDETDYSAEQLNVLLTCALNELRSAEAESEGALLTYLKHVFLGTIREKIEHKILAIEEDLERRKKQVQQTYSGEDQSDFESAIKDIEYCRIALTELVDAVQESSGCASLETLLHDHILKEPEPRLYETLEHSLNFMYILRSRVDAMLKDVVLFIRDCIAYRSLAFTVDSRDRLCRIQEKLLSHALEHDLRMPILDLPRIPRVDLNWSRQERERPVILDLNGLRTLEDFPAPELPPIEPAWKEPFLQTARNDWSEMAEQGGIDLGHWLKLLEEKLPEMSASPYLALWFLTQDWPGWSPGVALRHHRGRWISVGKDWMMEAIELVPAASDLRAHGPRRNWADRGNTE